MSIATGHAHCADGTRLAYRLYQHGDDVPRIALVHSLAMDHTFWMPVAERLANRASILIYDCRGHGASDKPAGPYTPPLFAADLASLMRHVGWPSAAVAGASTTRPMRSPPMWRALTPVGTSSSWKRQGCMTGCCATHWPRRALRSRGTTRPIPTTTRNRRAGAPRPILSMPGC